MTTILSIFANDVRSVSRRFFALAIIVAISVLPALYAWVNIYANGNPYANTGGISIAVASLDPGIDLEGGTHINMTEEVFEDLKGSDKIGWQFPESADAAIDGVRSGKYYAAVIFEDNFTYNMYHFEQAMLDEKAPITYYENQKRNAVAPKITQTAATTLQQSIKTKYLETVFSFIFDEAGDVADRVAEGDTADNIIAQLEGLRDTLRSYDSAISAFMAKSDKIHSGISNAENKLSKTAGSVDGTASDAEKSLLKARSSLSVLKTILELHESRIEKARTSLDNTLKKLNVGGLTEEQKKELTEQANKEADQLKAALEEMLASFPEEGSSASSKAVRSVLTAMISDVDTLKEMLNNGNQTETIMGELKALSQDSLSDSVQSLIDSLDRTLNLTSPLMDSMSSMLNSLLPVLGSADETVSGLDASLRQMQTLFRSTADDIDSIIDRVQQAKEEDKLALLKEFLGGDPEEFAAFFSALVDVEVEEIYPVASYGAAMAPFYSVLAIWVGGVILVSILKTHIDRKKFPDATDTQAFFGRFILFFLIGQVQAAVIVAGDIFMLGCAPVHPWLMWLSASVASFVFMLLIYALTISFGDIGKAIVVVIMVLQIAGSSGSYPIEILPVIFSKGYIFFPFPYAINAMREALCGTYAHDFWRYLAELLEFAVLALAVGLLVRKPFIGMNEFVSEKLEETEVL